MHLLQNLAPNDHMKIRLHKIKHQINILVVVSLDDLIQADDVAVGVQLLQKHNLPSHCILYLAIGSLRIS